jgi:ketosteroid isomerase-like protein
MMVRRAEALENAENQDVRGLLNKAADQASVLDYDADQMTGLLHSDVSWQTHATMLTAVKAHVNNLGQTIAKLQAERSQASTLQRQAIDRSVPLLRELASNTTDAIEHLNRNQIRPVSGDYPEYLDANADTAHELARLIETTVEYGHTRTKLERLQDEIQIASK